MNGCTAEVFGCNIFPGDGFHYLGTRYKHVTGLVAHDDHIREGGRINGTSGTRTKDG